ncbi:MAG: UMP kinase [Candidatus Aenigmarchaeota archaeon]|nr:UMP kinase [Candidatus Aenigmarchaeota archaeon]
MNIAMKVGGSVFCPGDKPDPRYVRELAGTLTSLSSRHSILVVVGGGRLARKLILEARKQGKSADEQHTAGIVASRMNASALIRELDGKAFKHVPGDVSEVRHAFGHGRIVVAGGFRPGQTTDAVTVQSALAIGADLIVIGTDVKGVYDKDPKVHEDAEFMREISSSDLLGIVGSVEVEPGKNTIVDHVAAELIRKSRKKVIVLDIRDLDNLVKAIEGGDFEGTIVKHG